MPIFDELRTREAFADGSSRVHRAAIPAFFIILLLAVPAFAASYAYNREEPPNVALNPFGWGGSYSNAGVLIGFTEGIPTSYTAGAPAYGGTIVTGDNALGFILVKTSSATLTRQLAYADARVSYTELDQRPRVESVPNDPLYGQQYAPVQLRTEVVWDRPAPADDVLVGLIDTGLDVAHADLIGRAWMNAGETPGDGVDNDGNGYIDDAFGYDFCRGLPNVADNFVHGTQVGGAVAALRDNAVGIAGHARAKLIVAKIVDPGSDVHCGVAGIAKAIRYAADHGALVLTMSWGLDGPSQTVNLAVAYARERGVAMVKSAGNTNGGATTSPAEAAGVTTVASIDENGLFVGTSGKGPHVDFAAAGVRVWTTAPGNAFMQGSGTSLAAANVAGVMALVLNHCPDLQRRPAELNALLEATAQDRGTAGKDVFYGAGIPDAGAAVAACAT